MRGDDTSNSGGKTEGKNQNVLTIGFMQILEQEAQ